MKSELCDHEMNMATSSVSPWNACLNLAESVQYFDSDSGLGYSQRLRGWVSFILVDFLPIVTAVCAVKEFIDGVRSMYQLRRIETPTGCKMMGMLDVKTNSSLSHLPFLTYRTVRAGSYGAYKWNHPR